jgi:hypothetical protein
MKKILLTLAAIATCNYAANAQRLVLYEEFTGENCAPCAATNPGLLALMTGGSNPSKILMIKYMSPIPSAGPFYYQNKAQSDTRLSYYSVPFAPYGRTDGFVDDPSSASSPGHPANMTQAKIDAEAAVASPFTIAVTGTWDGTHDNINAHIVVTATSAYAATTPKLRVALIEDVYFPLAPGNNTEKLFENVVRAMYPDASGTTIPATWTVSTSNTYNITCAVPSYVDKHGKNLRVVAWIQDDGAVSSTVPNIAQTGVSPVLDATLANDISSDSLTAQTFTCTTENPTVTLTNVGSTAITAATIYYNLDHGTWNNQPWTGSLAPGASTTVNLTGISGGSGGFHEIYDSVVMAGDNNGGNASSYSSFFWEKPGYATSAISTDFEGTLPTGYFQQVNSQGHYWALVNVTISSAPGVSHSGQKAIYVSNPAMGNGEVNYLIIPSPTFSNPMSISWATAYAQQKASDNDQLELVYSTDCGSNWTSLWSKAGAALATAPVMAITDPNSCTGCFLPTKSQWRGDAVNIGSLPANAMLAFRNTSGGGNFVFVDDINVFSAPASVNNTALSAGDISIYPNPANDVATLGFTLTAATSVQVEISDALGRTVSTIPSQEYNAGSQKITINTATMAAGLYNVKIITGANTTTKQLSVVK